MRKTNILRLISIIVPINFFISFCGYTYANTKTEIENQEKEKESVSNQIDSTKEKINEIKAEKTETQKQVANINSQIASYEDEIYQVQASLDILNKDIAEKQKGIEEKEKAYAENEELLKKRLVASYKTGKTSYLEFLFSSKDLTDFISKYYLIEKLTDHDTDLLNKLEKEKIQIQNEKEELEKKQKELKEEEEKLALKKEALAVVKREKNKVISNLTAEEQELEKELDELRAHEQEVSSKISALKAQYDRELAAARAKNNSGSTASTGNSKYGFGYPVSNPVIGTKYGVSGRYWSSGHHTGVDFRASTGTPVYSIGEGIVVDTGFSNAYGKFVEIYHGNNIYSFYAHGSSVNVSKNQRVSKGTHIMNSGATGNVTGPHLHFEIRTPGSRYSNCVNPMPYLP